MENSGKMPGWVWVVTEKKGEEENLFAFEDEKTGKKFIPVFREQEEGVVCQRGFKKKPGFQYDVEAMRLPLVADVARENQMDIYFLGADGEVLDALTPAPDA